MRTVALIVVGLILTGCSRHARPSEQAEIRGQASYEVVDRSYEPVSVGALAFDPPIVSQAATPNLSREGRDTVAYAGYDQVVTTYFYLRNDDRQVILDDTAGHYERRAVSHRFGVSYR